MRALVTFLACCAVGCGAGATGGNGGTTPAADPGAAEGAVQEVTALLEAHCESGLHTSPEYLGDPLLIVGTAGEIMEGRSLLEQTQESYGERGIEVRHDCSSVQRWVFSSPDGSVVWAEESIRTNARFPGIDVSFPAQRTLILQRAPEGWRLSFYSLAVRLPDENLDEAFGVGHQPEHGGEGGAPAAPAEDAASEEGASSE